MKIIITAYIVIALEVSSDQRIYCRHVVITNVNFTFFAISFSVHTIFYDVADKLCWSAVQDIISFLSNTFVEYNII
jgi:hypothetical protein